MEIYKCPICKLEAQIDRERKTKAIVHKIDLNRPRMNFPSHRDCELMRPISKMNFSLLQKKVIA